MDTKTTSHESKELMDELPSDPDELKRIIRVILEDDNANARQLEAALAEMKVLVSSWRWRIGDAVVSFARSLLNQKRVRLPTDHVLSRLNALVTKNHDRETLGISYIDYRDASELQFYRGTDAKYAYTKKKVEELEQFLSLQGKLDFPYCIQPTVSIVLVLYNRAELTYACLSSILKSVHTPYQLIIVDNASTDNTADLLDKVDGATVLVNPSNEGFLKACNLAAGHADGEYLLFLNNDAVLVGDAVSKAMVVFDEEQGVGGVGGKILLLDGSLQEAGSIVWQDGSCLGYGRDQASTNPEFMFRRDVDYCSGAFFMAPTALFIQMGKFDTDYLPAYYEETDFCVRLHQSGYRVVYDPEITILHYEFASSSKSDDAVRLQQEHRKIFVQKHPAYLNNCSSPDVSNILSARCFGKRKNLLFIDDRVPHGYFGSGFPRSNFILNVLSGMGYQITMYPLNFPLEDDWNSVYSDIPKTVEVMLGYGRARLEQFLNDRTGFYDVIYISRPHNMEFFRSVAGKSSTTIKGATIIYDAEAIFSLRDAIRYKLFSGKKKKNFEKDIKAEIDLVSNADIVIAVSEKEREVFRSYYDGAIEVVGHAMDIVATTNSFDQRSNFLFVGNMDYDGSPNVDSMVWFVRKVLPLIQQSIPDAQLTLVGTSESSEIQQLSGDNVRLMGRQDDLRGFYESSRVFLAPTRYAGGIPYKVHEAAAFGVPVVATNLIVDQLSWINGQHILGSDHTDAKEFARQCISLYSNEVIWNNIRDEALTVMRQDCCEQSVVENVKRVFK